MKQKLTKKQRKGGSPETKTKQKRCPKGTRRNKKTGECEKMPEKETKKTPSPSPKKTPSPSPSPSPKPTTSKTYEYMCITYPSKEHAYQAQKYKCTKKPELAVKLFSTETTKFSTEEEAKQAGDPEQIKKNSGDEFDEECWKRMQEQLDLDVKFRKN